MNLEQDENEIDLREILHILIKRLPIIIAVTAVFGIAGVLFSCYVIEPKYASTSKIYVMSTSDANFSISDLDLSTGLTADYVELIQSRPVMEQVIEDLHLNMSYEGLLGLVTITNPTDTRILYIKVTYTDPIMAKEMANDIVAVSQKAIKEIMHTDEPSIVEDAISTGEKVSPSNTKNTLLAALIGLFLSCGIIIARYLLDDTVKTVDDVEHYLGYNTLGIIPDDGGKRKSKKKKEAKRHTPENLTPEEPAKEETTDAQIEEREEESVQENPETEQEESKTEDSKPETAKKEGKEGE